MRGPRYDTWIMKLPEEGQSNWIGSKMYSKLIINEPWMSEWLEETVDRVCPRVDRQYCNYFILRESHKIANKFQWTVCLILVALYFFVDYSNWKLTIFHKLIWRVRSVTSQLNLFCKHAMILLFIYNATDFRLMMQNFIKLNVTIPFSICLLIRNLFLPLPLKSSPSATLHSRKGTSSVILPS